MAPPNHRFIGSVALSLVDLSATTGTFSGALTADSAAITNGITAATVTTTGAISGVGVAAGAGALTGASVTVTGDVGCATVTATGAIAGASLTTTGAIAGVGVAAGAGALTGASVTVTGDVGCATVTATSTISATTSVSVASGSASLVSSGVQSGSSASRCYSTHATAGWTLLSNVTSAADVSATYQAAVNSLTHDGAAVVTGTHNNGAAFAYRVSALGGYAIYLTNKSGGAVATGDVVVIDTTTASSFTTTTSADDIKVIGAVLSSSIANDASGWVVVSGVAKVSVTGTVAIGDVLATDVNAKKAITQGTPVANAILGKALTADAAGYCTALIQTR